MLQDIRKSSQGTAAKIIVGLIVVSFSIFGIESILLGGSGNGVAEVNGEAIEPGEVDQLVNTQKRRLIAMMGENLDPAMLDDQRLRTQALDSIIGRKLQMQSAQELKLAISDQQIGTVVASMEQFQINGQFSPEMYKNILAGAGYTPASFKQSLMQDLILNQLNSGLAGSDFATAAELELNAAYTGESRDVRYLTIPLQLFSDGQEVSDAEIEQHYAANESTFMTPESVDLDYIELSIEDFRKPVEEAEIQQQYELEKENYQYKSESGVSHILFERGEDENTEAFDQRIKAVQDELAAGADFAEQARASSDDIGSASYGGDLGFTQGDTFPEEMEAAIAQLEAGQVSAPVTTDAGVHLIRLNERRDGEMPPLEELRAVLEDRVQLQEARRELTLMVENLKDLAFNAEDLSSPAEELALEVMRAEGISRNHREGVFANPTLLTEAFSNEVLEEGHNSDVIELANDTYVAMWVRNHNQPELRPLDDVRGQIVASINEQSSRRAVTEAAEQALEALTSGVSVEDYAKEKGYDWQVELSASRTNAMVPRPVLQRLFELPAPTEGESTYEYVQAPTGDIQVFELARVTPGALDALAPSDKSRLKQQVTNEFGGMVNVEFQRGLRDKAEISVL